LHRSIENTVYGDIIKACLVVAPEERISLALLGNIIFKLKNIFDVSSDDQDQQDIDFTIDEYRETFIKVIRGDADPEDISVDKIQRNFNRKMNRAHNEPNKQKDQNIYVQLAT